MVHPKFLKRLEQINRQKHNSKVLKTYSKFNEVEEDSIDRLNKQLKLLEKRTRILENLVIDILEEKKKSKTRR